MNEYFIGPLCRDMRDDASKHFIGFEFKKEADCEYWADITGWARKGRTELYITPVTKEIRIFLQTKEEVEKLNHAKLLQRLLG